MFRFGGIGLDSFESFISANQKQLSSAFFSILVTKGEIVGIVKHSPAEGVV